MSRLLGGLLALYAAAIQVGSVVLAWHYAVDGYFGAILAFRVPGLSQGSCPAPIKAAICG